MTEQVPLQSDKSLWCRNWAVSAESGIMLAWMGITKRSWLTRFATDVP
jgi:hypothetical protein